MSKEEKKQRKKKKRGFLALITVAMLTVVALCSIFAWYQVDNLEEGILDVCATQQDAYVQLVLDQINLKENRDDEEIIEEILGTLDASTNKYWTFSKDRDMLFVKDVVETNRYKGLTTVSYYDSPSAREFLEGLRVDQVVHRNITIDGKEYIASGVAFHYGEEDYRLCLLTNKSVILNSNTFMVAELEMIILVGTMMVILLAVTIFLARKLETSLIKINQQGNTISTLQQAVGDLNELLNQKEHYDTRYQIWSKDVIKSFLEKVKAKGVKKAVVAKVCCADKEKRTGFIETASVLLDKKFLRFALNDTDILLLCLQRTTEDVEKNLEPLLKAGVVLKKVEEISFADMDMGSYIQELEAQG